MTTLAPRDAALRPVAQRKRLRVLGIDPAATGPTGYGVVETDGRACRMLRFGALGVRRPVDFPARLCEIHALILELIEEYAPDGLAVESVFTALNMKTALRLAEVRGVVMLAAAQGNVPVHSYSPREVKASVAGYGHASKQQMQLMVRALLRMAQTPEPSDAADALAVALCHIQAARARARWAAADGFRPGKPASRSRPAAARIPVLR